MKTITIHIAAAMCAAAVVSGCSLRPAADASASTVELRVNHLAYPANVSSRPTFSWKMSSARNGARQTAYRIAVREDAPDGAAVWESGIVKSGESVGIRYAGAALKSARRYFWKVGVCDEKGAWLSPVEGFFETGLLSADDWDGSVWISAADSRVKKTSSRLRDDGMPAYDGKDGHEAEPGTSCFVKGIANGKAVKEAYWTVTGLGVFEAYVNGKPVSRKCGRTGTLTRDFLKPGFTHALKTRHSFTYDVTHLMKTGASDSNVFAAQVSAGWWRDRIVSFVGRKSGFRAQLILRYADGTERRVGTDATWLSAVAGSVKSAAIFDGEDYDARIGNAWMAEASPSGFKASEPNGEFKGNIFPMEGAPVRLRCDLALSPSEMYVWKGVDGVKPNEFGTVRKLRTYRDGDVVELEAGETLVVDFAQNAAAVPSFEFSAAAGTVLKMLPAEMLNDGNGAKSRGNDGPEGSIYFTNYRRAKTTLTYTFAGTGVEKYHPEFTFFGYRYASMTATGKVRISKVRSIPVTSILKSTETGRLSTGVADVNRLVSNILWGQYSNYLSVPTDCPQRNERLGWTADTQVFAQAGSFNADTYGFLVKWMRDMRDTQYPDGSYTGVAPSAQYGQTVHQLGWADAGIIVPYAMWRQFGDAQIIDENWESMKRFMALLDAMKYTSEQSMAHQWADWLSYEAMETNSGRAYTKDANGKRQVSDEAKQYWQYLGGCYWLWDSRMMAEMAKATGREADAGYFDAMSGRALEYVREKFVAQDGMLLPLFRGMQTPALFALKLGLLEKPQAIAATKASLLENFKAHGDCLQTGFLGTSILMDTLTYDVGAPEMAYALLLQHKNPSWLYSVDQGATTIWERWNSYVKATGFGPSGMNSFNHYAYGAVLSWMYGTMAGIRAGDCGGYRHFILAPIPDRRVGKVDAEFNSPYGKIRSSWAYAGNGGCSWTFTIPANTTATVRLPNGKTEELAAGTYTRTLVSAK